MEQLQFSYDDTELAWVTPEFLPQRDIYLMVTLNEPGKIVVRQHLPDGTAPRAPVRRHRDTRRFILRIVMMDDNIALQIFTSTEPKEIKYAYISRRP